MNLEHNCRNVIAAILTLFLLSCGTSGHIKFYSFGATKSEIQNQISSIISKDSQFTVPKKWLECTTGDYFERYYIYFSKNPEEMYQIGFTGDSLEWNNSSSSKLGLIAVYDGKIFKYESDLSSREIKRIEKRFEEEILSKLSLPYQSQ